MMNEQLSLFSRMEGFGDYVMDDQASSLKQRDYKDSTDLVLLMVDDGTEDE